MRACLERRPGPEFVGAAQVRLQSWQVAEWREGGGAVVGDAWDGMWEKEEVAEEEQDEEDGEDCGGVGLVEGGEGV